MNNVFLSVIVVDNDESIDITAITAGITSSMTELSALSGYKYFDSKDGAYTMKAGATITPTKGEEDNNGKLDESNEIKWAVSKGLLDDGSATETLRSDLKDLNGKNVNLYIFDKTTPTSGLMYQALGFVLNVEKITTGNGEEIWTFTATQQKEDTLTDRVLPNIYTA